MAGKKERQQQQQDKCLKNALQRTLDTKDELIVSWFCGAISDCIKEHRGMVTLQHIYDTCSTMLLSYSICHSENDAWTVCLGLCTKLFVLCS